MFQHTASSAVYCQLVKLAIPATACNMSASFVGRVPAEIAALIFEYAIDPAGPLCQRRPPNCLAVLAHFQMDALLSVSYFLVLPCWNISLCYQTKSGLVCCAMHRFS